MYNQKICEQNIKLTRVLYWCCLFFLMVWIRRGAKNPLHWLSFFWLDFKCKTVTRWLAPQFNKKYELYMNTKAPYILISFRKWTNYRGEMVFFIFYKRHSLLLAICTFIFSYYITIPIMQTIYVLMMILLAIIMPQQSNFKLFRAINMTER